MKKLLIALFILLTLLFTASLTSFTEQEYAINTGTAKDLPIELVVQQGHSSDVSSVRFSPDGKYLSKLKY